MNYSTFREMVIKMYLGVEQKISVFCQNSLLCEGTTGFFRALLVCLDGSFLGRLDGSGFLGNPKIINGSKIVGLVRLIYRRIIGRVTSLLGANKIYFFSSELKEALSSETVRSLAIVLVIATLLHFLLSALFGREITPLGWLIRGLIVFLGWGGSYCTVSWQGLQKTSFVVAYIKSIANLKIKH